ncbi:general secretion pathway protein GspK [Hyphomicrobium facile]|uniref:General secretion pathway protein K n=1 Tax=Hyphomicrobium facile TaxID=51670 RepID=A0A1I7N4K4_9HYPH|nr:type II secretion system protein GspK [Hyphomicrobium facile]SFV29588.1 general secretion pathway protein K [Hyphomicrobium facile]
MSRPVFPLSGAYSDRDAGRQRGVALLIVLWIIASAALLVSAFGVTARSGASLASSEIQITTAEALLDAGAEIAAAHLIDDDADLRWLADGKPHQVVFAGANLKITIADPNGLIDLNRADGGLLLGLFRQFTSSEQQAREIRDRILKTRGEAAGDLDQNIKNTSAKSNDPSRPAAFLDVTQLRYVEGMTLELYKQLLPYLTVYSREGLVNPLSAPDAVLSSIPNMTLFDIEKVRTYMRAASDDQSSAPPVMDKVSSFFTDETGPAYLVSVETQRPGQDYRAAKAFVLMPAFDNDAPYRLISERPLALLN